MSLTNDIRRAYDEAGESWDLGPSRVYRALAQPVLDAAGDVTGARALDVGTGSGVLAEELVRRGARVVGLDLSLGMLVRRAVERPPGVVADVRRLPVRSHVADLVTASFVLNHLHDPLPAVRELRRVLREGGRVLATTFEGEAPHPAKSALDGVAASFGWVAPDWYLEVKAGTMPVLGSPSLFVAAAEEGGLSDVHVDRVAVTLHLSPGELVAWRYGMAQHSSFVARQSPQRRAALLLAAEQAVASLAQPVAMTVLLLSASA
jgi:SAM-dependent methyltransferase